MSLIIPHYLYYICFGFAIALCMYFTLGLFYVNKLRPNIDASVKDEEPKIKYSNFEKKIRLFLSIIGVSIILVTGYFVIPETTGGYLTKVFTFGLGSFAYLVMSTLDLKNGEVYVFELGFTNTFCMFLFPVIVNFIFGCRCISKALLITFGAYLILKIINYFFNKELSIGGADIDTIASLVAAVIATFIAIGKRESQPVFVETFYLETLFTLIFINFTITILGYFIIKIVKNVKERKENIDNIINESNKKSITVSEDIAEDKSKDNSENEPEDSKNLSEENSEEAVDIETSDEENNKKKKNNKKSKMNFRCLPSFILIYNFVLFVLLFY